MKRYLYVISALLIACFSSCSSSDDPKPDEPKEDLDGRTILVYMVANNNLGSNNYDEKNIVQMEAAVAAGALGTNDHLLYYQHDYKSIGKLYEVTAQGRSLLKEYTDENLIAIDPERAQEVISDVVALAPAESYGLILWSHGTGWIEGDQSRTLAAQSEEETMTDIASSRPIYYSFGSDGGYEMNVPTMKDAFGGVVDWKFIYFDCCHMITTEVMYEIGSLAPVMIGSTTELPIEGMPYTVNIPCMFEEEPDYAAIAYNTYNLYIDSSTGCSMTVVNTNAMDDLAKATKAIMEVAQPLESTYKGVKLWRSSAVTVYLYDMKDYIHALTDDTALLTAWDTAYSKAVVANYNTPLCFTVAMTNFTGLGCYIPELNGNSVTLKGYNTLKWYDDVVKYNANLTAE